MAERPPRPFAASIPVAFLETIKTLSVSAPGASIEASIMPSAGRLLHLATAEAAAHATATIPTERLARQGRRLQISDVGRLEEGPPAGDAHYEVEEVIGVGGMGLVCAARQRSLQREVALKISLKADSGSGSQGATHAELKQFTNEALVTAGLDHPNVVPVHGLAKDETGKLFFTMKRVQGLSWKQLLEPETAADEALRQELRRRSEQLSLDDHLEILLKVADAVAYAHSKQLLHRDLKPENVMLGSYGEVLVMDWGLAMGFGSRNPYLDDPDREIHLAGTPAYMAPEMARGEMDQLCPATDVYLLGGILYRLLTGRPPHHYDDMYGAIGHASAGVVDPPDPSVAPPELAQIVMRALAPEIADRYPSVRELQEDLRRYRDNAESLAVAADAERMLAALRSELAAAGGEQAAAAYGRLSEIVGAHRQALRLWAENRRAREGLIEALELQIELALRQGDLTLARAQLEQLSELAPDSQLEALRGELRRRTAEQQTIQRRALLQRRLAVGAALLVLTTIVGALVMALRQRELTDENLRAADRQRQLAEENLRLTGRLHRRLFAQAVAGRAALLRRYLQEIERTVDQHRAEAERLMALPERHLPFRPRSRSGRDGYYLDEDYYGANTSPLDVRPHEGYAFPVSMSESTVKLAPRASAGAARRRALADVRRLSRLSPQVAHAHRARREFTWSVIGTRSGALISFPGSGRYRDKPEYDPTTRPWFKGTLTTTGPRWIDPHVDAAGTGLLITCSAPIRVQGQGQGRDVVGVVGVELSLETIQRLVLELAQGAGASARGLLVRADGRVVVDTSYAADPSRWKERFRLATVDSIGGELARHFRRIRAGAVGSQLGGSGLLISHAPLVRPDWTLLLMQRQR